MATVHSIHRGGTTPFAARGLSCSTALTTAYGLGDSEIRLGRMMRDPHKAEKKAARKAARIAARTSTVATVATPPRYLSKAELFHRATENLSNDAKLALLDAIQKGYATA